MALHFGLIVYALDAIPDPQRRNYKANRPFIVISENEYIAVSEDFEGIAISHSTWTDESDAVPIPFSFSTHQRCYTALSTPSVAICNWKVVLNQDRVTTNRGYVKPTEMEMILLKSRGVAPCFRQSEQDNNGT